MKRAKETQKVRFDKRSNPVVFQVGDQVQLLVEAARQGRSKKLGPQWTGRYTIVDKIGEVDFKIKMGRAEKIVHGNKLKHYY